MKLLQEFCLWSISLGSNNEDVKGSNNEDVKAIKESIEDIQVEIEEHMQASEELKLKEANILQIPQKSNLTPHFWTAEWIFIKSMIC